MHEDMGYNIYSRFYHIFYTLHRFRITQEPLVTKLHDVSTIYGFDVVCTVRHIAMCI